jgi:hypothetical protein
MSDLCSIAFALADAEGRSPGDPGNTRKVRLGRSPDQRLARFRRAPAVATMNTVAIGKRPSVQQKAPPAMGRKQAGLGGAACCGSRGTIRPAGYDVGMTRG